ncbi:MAG: hypothetical protein JW787_02745, partial [Sedimentisphaerales bacterium]|nr:hypothetical protein [Sedimentisphaerales bacterium]
SHILGTLLAIDMKVYEQLQNYFVKQSQIQQEHRTQNTGHRIQNTGYRIEKQSQFIANDQILTTNDNKAAKQSQFFNRIFLAIFITSFNTGFYVAFYRRSFIMKERQSTA